MKTVNKLRQTHVILEVPEDCGGKLATRARHLEGQTVTPLVTNWSDSRGEHVCQIQSGERLFSVPAAWLRVRVTELPTPTSEEGPADGT